MCRVLEVSRSSYYRWYSGFKSKCTLENEKLMLVIEKVFNESNHTYGSPRITAHLNNHGYSISKPRVAKLMQDQGLKSKVKKKYRLTTNSKHRYANSSNHLNRNFSTQRLNQVWVSDIT